MNYTNKLILIIFLISFKGFTQEKLTKEDAVSIALEQNYGIKLAKNNVEIAKNNASIYNSNHLPSITASGNGTYSNSNLENTLQNGNKSTIDDAEAKNYSASVGLNYTLFDGLGRSYNYQKLKENYNVTELEAQTVIENTLLQLFYLYYEVARLSENSKNILETLNISKQRLERATYAFEYGQNTKLQVLNAEVDINNDSIQYINSLQLLSNAKRDLNLLLARNVATPFTVDTEVAFNTIYNLEELLEKAKQQNTKLQIVHKNVEINQLNLKINKANLFPKLSLNSAYKWTKADNDNTFNYAEQLTKGINAGVTLNWNIFDGGSTKTKIQNSKIATTNALIQQEASENQLIRDVSTAFEVYQNALFILQAEEKNVTTNKINFSRTEEQFKLGQVSSIEFRQAQINLLNAKSNLNQATYDAKNAELYLLQLSGDLLYTKF